MEVSRSIVHSVDRIYTTGESELKTMITYVYGGDRGVCFALGVLVREILLLDRPAGIDSTC